MKLNFLILTLALAAASPVFAAERQPQKDGVTLSGLSITSEGDSLRVRFRARVGQNATDGRNYKLTLRPVLTGGGHERSLRSIEVHGRRVEILDARTGAPHVAGLAPNDHRQPVVGALRAHEGETVDYSVALPLEKWMETAGLRIERQRSGCCRTEPLAEVVAADQTAPVELTADGVASRARALSELAGSMSTGDSLARALGFVESLAALEERQRKMEGSQNLFDPNMQLDMGRSSDTKQQREIDKYIADESEKGALTIHFKRGKYDLERHFRENNMTLVNLVSSIRTLMESKSSRIARVVIVGSASPEGTLAFNDRLAWNRAVTLKEFLRRNTKYPGDSITLFNGSENWHGLRRMVAASDLYERDRILEIIDNVPIKAGRESELMKLDGGRPYLHMLEHMFPELRNTAFIKVYYENLSDPAAEALAAGAALVAQGRYTEALAVLRAAAPGAERDLLEGSALLFSGDEAGAVPLLERAAAGGEREAAALLGKMRAKAEARTFGPVELPGRK